MLGRLSQSRKFEGWGRVFCGEVQCGQMSCLLFSADLGEGLREAEYLNSAPATTFYGISLSLSRTDYLSENFVIPNSSAED